MMTRKDFDVVAKEIGWDFFLKGIFIGDGMLCEFLPYNGQQSIEASTLKSAEEMLTLLCSAFRTINPNFDRHTFTRKINFYAVMAAKKGNAIFE